MSSDRQLKAFLGRIFIIVGAVLSIISLFYPEDSYLLWIGLTLSLLGFLRDLVVQPATEQQAKKRRAAIVFFVVFMNLLVGFWLFW